MKAVIDVETGGFSTTKNGICEIGIIFLDNDLNVIGEYEALIAPYTRADDTKEMVSYKEDAMNVNGISLWELEFKGICVKTVCRDLSDLLEYYDTKYLIGHNVKFDHSKVDYLFERFNKDNLKMELIDTIKLTREKYKGLKSYSLPNLCKHFNIQNKQEHRAIGDCKATLELYKLVI